MEEIADVAELCEEDKLCIEISLKEPMSESHGDNPNVRVFRKKLIEEVVLPQAAVEEEKEEENDEV